MSDEAEVTSGLSSIITGGVLFVPPSEDCECLTCDGRGGKLEQDIDGDGVWATPVWRFYPCDDCIGSERCPGCGHSMTPEQQAAAYYDIETFTCANEACGWSYDADRFNSGDEGWGYDGW